MNEREEIVEAAEWAKAGEAWRNRSAWQKVKWRWGGLCMWEKACFIVMLPVAALLLPLLAVGQVIHSAAEAWYILTGGRD